VKPYYETKQGRLYQGDCLEVMQKLADEGVKVDMVLTDPPYGMRFQSCRRSKKHPPIAGDTETGWLHEVIKLANSLSKNNSAHYMFCSRHNIDIFKREIEGMFKIKNLLVWVKNNISMGDLSASFAPKTEFIWMFQKGRTKIRGKRDPDVLFFDKVPSTYHPTTKPVPLIQYLIEKFTDEGDLVIDPFLGSGTTAIAAERTGRRWIGIELSEEYCVIAKQRLEKETQQ
jgi:site-specific DNA-methyltransferase (adenine-specific)